MSKMAKYVVMVFILALLVSGCQNSITSVESETNNPSLAKWVLPDGATFMSATFNIYATHASYQTVNVYRVTDTWEEMSVTWNSLNGAYDTTAVGSFECDTTGWHSVDLTSTVMGWLNGDYPDYGVLLDQDIIIHPRGVYYSRESAVHDSYLALTYLKDSVEVTEYAMVEADAYISESMPESNFGDDIYIFTGYAADYNSEKQSLLWFDIENRPEQEGCSYTIGYWKNHAGMKRQDDMVSPLLPLWLGDDGGDKSLAVEDRYMAVDILKMNVYGHEDNGITKLYAQLLATKLNIANGASDDDVADYIAEADEILAMYDWNDWDSLDQETRQHILYLKDMFDYYNNGLIGPGHCDD